MSRRRWFLRGFAIDARSLAAFRMAMAGVLLFDLAERARNLADHYTDWGVFPRAARAAMDENGSTNAGSWAWSLHMATGTTWGQAVLFLVAGFFAVWLLIGYRTRLAAVICWLLTVSIYYRSPVVSDVGDTVLRTTLFWAIFLPLGAAASVDARLRRCDRPTPREIASIPAAALILQVCMAYWTAAAEKTTAVWLTDHTALHYALSLDGFATPLGHQLLAYPRLLAWLTASVYWLEWIGPALVLCPFGRDLLRLIAVLAFWAFHLGIVLTMGLGTLPWVSIAVWTLFLPGTLWDKLGWRPPEGSVPERQLPCRLLGQATTAVVALLSLYIVGWNISRVVADGEPWSPAWRAPAYVLGIDQDWRMFAPSPPTEDGWYEMRGVLVDGSVVNLWEPDRPLPHVKPSDVRATYGNRRWQKYLMEIRRGWASYVPEFADWLRRRWNDRYAGDAAGRRLKRMEIIFHLKNTLSPGLTSTLVVPEILFEADYNSSPGAE
ncbi:MAG TPA: HTTM domain-containing protein [Pirellulales bacterium]|jgi:hypothetical protein|nr:HTTM domain-containing protein [Pirellulales bacterium]